MAQSGGFAQPSGFAQPAYNLANIYRQMGMAAPAAAPRPAAPAAQPSWMANVYRQLGLGGAPGAMGAGVAAPRPAAPAPAPMMPQLQMPPGTPQAAYPAPALTQFVNPLGAQVAGGLNALNQAAFGNIGAPTSEFGIVPSAPGNLPTYTAQQFAVPTSQGGRTNLGGTPSGMGTLGGGRAQGANALQTALQRLGIHLPGASFQGHPAAAGVAGPRGAAQGGPGVGSTAAREAIDRFIGSNRMQSPNLASALKMGSMVAGPTGLAMGLGNLALGDPMGQLASALGLGQAGQSAFNPGGSWLSPDALRNVETAFNNALNPGATNITQAKAAAEAQMSVERAIQSFGPQPMAQMGYSPGMAAMIGQYSGAPVDPFRPGAGGGGGGGSFGGGGPDTGGGLGGGPGNIGGGQSRSM